jgi:uncharacterized protein (TIGR03067 family)
MLKNLIIVIAGLMLLPLARSVADAPDNAATKELKKLQGEWRVTNIEPDPQKFFQNQQITLVIKGKHLTVKGFEEFEKKFAKVGLTIDPSVTPKIMDFKIEEGSAKDNVFEGIYELKGEELRICASNERGNRPGEFEAKEGSQRVLLVLKRATP